MPVGQVITLVVTRLLLLAALAPPRPRPVAMAAFLVGQTVNELPHVFGVLLLISMGPALLGADPTRPGQSAALVFTALEFGGFCWLVVRGMRAAPVVERAVTATGLGRPMRTPRWRVQLTPYPIRPRRIERAADILYGSDGRQRLDVYRRADAPADGPVLVYLHGGGYFSGSKHHEARALLYRLADRGWICISANYRLRPHAGFEEHLADAKAVLAWAHEHARPGATGPPVVMAGSSAGAHLSLLCALGQGREPRGDGSAADAVAAVIALYGYYGRYYGRGPDESPVSDPGALDASAAPPIFMAHGELDNYVPVHSARAMAQHLRDGSAAPVVYAELPGGQHAFDVFRSWRFTAVLDGVDAFLQGLELEPRGSAQRHVAVRD